MKADAFGDRMKQYEAASDTVLPIRLPVILRLDGNSFSKFTKDLKLDKPFDPRFDAAMNDAAQATMQYVHGLVAYVQSDEITILLRNDRTDGDTPFLGNRIQKIASLAAATCSVAFYDALIERGVLPWGAKNRPIFDCRVFVVPPSEVNNVFLWRQKDAFKNCIGAYAYFGLAKKVGKGTAMQMLHGKSTKERQEIIFSELGTNPNDLPTAWKRGRCISRVLTHVPLETLVSPEKYAQLVAANRVPNDGLVARAEYRVDTEIPEFNLDRDYIGKHLTAGR